MRGWQLLISGILLCGLSVSSCTAPSAATPRITFVGDPPTWAETATATMAELEQWRGLPFKDNLEITFQPQDNPRLNGWYNSETKQLVVSADGSDELGRGVMLHEMFHALQDQQFDLYTLHLQSQNNADYDKAVTAIIEGEAMLAVSELMNYDFLAHAQLPPEGEISEQLFENIFLYGAGLKFIKAIRDEGGWDAVDDAFASPPQATTLILNPDRYLAGERTIAPTEVPLKTGETLTSTTMRGEYAVRLLLAQQPTTRFLLDSLDISYMTDTLGVITNDSGDTIHRWVLEFDQAGDITPVATALKTALAADLEQQPKAATNENIITLEW